MYLIYQGQVVKAWSAQKKADWSNKFAFTNLSRKISKYHIDQYDLLKWYSDLFSTLIAMLPSTSFGNAWCGLWSLLLESKICVKSFWTCRVPKPNCQVATFATCASDHLIYIHTLLKGSSLDNYIRCNSYQCDTTGPAKKNCETVELCTSSELLTNHLHPSLLCKNSNHWPDSHVPVHREDYSKDLCRKPTSIFNTSIIRSTVIKTSATSPHIFLLSWKSRLPLQSQGHQLGHLELPGQLPHLSFIIIWCRVRPLQIGESPSVFIGGFAGGLQHSFERSAEWWRKQTKAELMLTVVDVFRCDIW